MFRLKKPDYATFSREIRGRNALQRVSPANFPGKRSIIWLLQTKCVATLAVCRNLFLQTGRRCNAFRLKKPDYATFSREIRGRNALQRVSPANFPGKRSIIWLLQTKRVATLSVCRNTLFLQTRFGRRSAQKRVAT